MKWTFEDLAGEAAPGSEEQGRLRCEGPLQVLKGVRFQRLLSNEVTVGLL